MGLVSKITNLFRKAPSLKSKEPIAREIKQMSLREEILQSRFDAKWEASRQRVQKRVSRG